MSFGSFGWTDTELAHTDLLSGCADVFALNHGGMTPAARGCAHELDHRSDHHGTSRCDALDARDRDAESFDELGPDRDAGSNVDHRGAECCVTAPAVNA